MDITINQALGVLEEQLKPLDERAAKLEAELAATKDTRKRLKMAVAALRGGKATTKNQAQKKCAKKADVISVIEKLLQDNGTMPVDDLRELSRSNITEKNWSLSGFELRFKEALKSGLFDVSPDNSVSLAATTKPSQAR